MEGMGDISVYMSTLGPEGWSHARRLSDDPARSEQNPVLFTAPDGAVWLFHTSQPGGRQDECEIVARVSQDGGASFGPARRIGDFRGVFVRQPVQLWPGGRMALARLSLRDPCRRALDRRHRQRGDAGVARSGAKLAGGRGAGQSGGRPHEPGRAPCRGHARLLPRPLCPMGQAQPFHRWRTDLDARRTPTDLPNNNSSVQAVRLADGRIAMVLNPVSAAQSDARRASLYDEIEGRGRGAGGDRRAQRRSGAFRARP